MVNQKIKKTLAEPEIVRRRRKDLDVYLIGFAILNVTRQTQLMQRIKLPVAVELKELQR